MENFIFAPNLGAVLNLTWENFFFKLSSIGQSTSATWCCGSSIYSQSVQHLTIYKHLSFFISPGFNASEELN